MKRFIINLLFVLFYTSLTAQQFTLLDVDTVWTTTTIFRNLSTEQPDNWLSPYNYYDGAIYVKLEILDKPSDIEVIAHWCFWENESEICYSRGDSKMRFAKPGTYYAKITAPDDKTKWRLCNLNENSEAQFFSGNNKLEMVQFQWWIKYGEHLKVLRFKGDNPEEAEKEDLGEEVYKHIPIKFRSKIIVVAKDAEFNPPEDW